MGLAAAGVYFLSRVSFQSYGCIVGRCRGAYGNHAKYGIRTGVDCLRRFRQGFSEITDPEEKVKFTLAAYNAGIGHIYDAQRLARKYGKDPNKWDNNVAEYIRLKNDPEYYNDPVCKHGYLRGSETYNYVREVLERYHYYKKKS